MLLVASRLSRRVESLNRSLVQDSKSAVRVSAARKSDTCRDLVSGAASESEESVESSSKSRNVTFGPWTK